jgi:hypothetical protein
MMVVVGAVTALGMGFVNGNGGGEEGFGFGGCWGDCGGLCPRFVSESGLGGRAAVVALD